TAAGVSHCERGNDRIAGPGYIEYLSGERRQMMRCMIGEERHSFLAASNEQIFAPELLKDLPARSLQGFAGADGHSAQQFRLTLVWSQHCNRMVVVGVVDLRIEKHGDSCGSSL